MLNNIKEKQIMDRIIVTLTEAQRQELMRIVNSGKSESRLVTRARIILDAADGVSASASARKLSVSRPMVVKWRGRFRDMGVDGLRDAPRSGQPVRYGDEFERMVLAVLDERPPEGYALWNGMLVARRLGVKADQVWKVMRKNGIHLARRRSWCVSTDPEFASRAADIVGLYLNPPENAVVVCVDEKPCIQAVERQQGWLRFPDGKTMMGFSDRYRRNGSSTLFAALEVATGQVIASNRLRKRRREFLDFMNEVVAARPEGELHVVLDNLSTHSKKDDRWLKKHPRVHFHYTPTNASWLNQVEVFFSILSRGALQGGSFESVSRLRGAINKFIAAYNERAVPFEWKKTCVNPKQLQNLYSN